MVYELSMWSEFMFYAILVVRMYNLYRTHSNYLWGIFFCIRRFNIIVYRYHNF